jgi:hypothetical protein
MAEETLEWIIVEIALIRDKADSSCSSLKGIAGVCKT